MLLHEKESPDTEMVACSNDGKENLRLIAFVRFAILRIGLRRRTRLYTPATRVLTSITSLR